MEISIEKLEKLYNEDPYSIRYRLLYYSQNTCFPWFCDKSKNTKLLLIQLYDGEQNIHLWCESCLPGSVKVIRELSAKEIFMLQLLITR